MLAMYLLAFIQKSFQKGTKDCFQNKYGCTLMLLIEFECYRPILCVCTLYDFKCDKFDCKNQQDVSICNWFYISQKQFLFISVIRMQSVAQNRPWLQTFITKLKSNFHNLIFVSCCETFRPWIFIILNQYASSHLATFNN